MKWKERSARAGARYTEYLRAHWGVAPRDERLQRAEYIGGVKTPVIISEVLQTSQSNVDTDAMAALGQFAGHGISLDRGFIGKYHCPEYGYIIGILSVIPRTMYHQGFDRHYLRATSFDWPHPEFVNLSEQAVTAGEIKAVGSNADDAIFGYQGRYNELRHMRSTVHGDFHDTLNYWHLAREFASTPVLNSSFVHVDPQAQSRIFAVQHDGSGNAVSQLLVRLTNKVKAIRPIPLIPEPGLIDHH